MQMSESSRAELSELLQSISERIAANHAPGDDAPELEREAEQHLSAVRDSLMAVDATIDRRRSTSTHVVHEQLTQIEGGIKTEVV